MFLETEIWDTGEEQQGSPELKGCLEELHTFKSVIYLKASLLKRILLNLKKSWAEGRTQGRSDLSAGEVDVPTLARYSACADPI